VSYLQDYWENVGSLVRAGHIELRMLEAFGGMCRWWWAALEPNIRRHRVATDNARSGENFEWLAASIATMEARSGPGRVVDADYLSRTLDQAIEREVGRIRVAEQLRAVVTVPPVATQAPSNGAALDRLVDSPA
jgi:hypothetical protein